MPLALIKALANCLPFFAGLAVEFCTERMQLDIRIVSNERGVPC